MQKGQQGMLLKNWWIRFGLNYKIYFNAIILIRFFTAIFLITTGIHGQDNKAGSANKLFDPELPYNKYTPSRTDRVISRTKYLDQLQGFWLAQCIANWTGLITEMDKIEPPFYTDDNWGTLFPMLIPSISTLSMRISPGALMMIQTLNTCINTY